MQKQARTEMKMKMKNIHTNSNQTSMKWQQQKRTGSYIYVSYLYMIAILCMAVLLIFFLSTFISLRFRIPYRAIHECIDCASVSVLHRVEYAMYHISSTGSAMYYTEWIHAYHTKTILSPIYFLADAKYIGISLNECKDIRRHRVRGGAAVHYYYCTC